MDAKHGKIERFIDEYLVDRNATQAAMRAGYATRTARSQGQRLLTRPGVAEAIEERTEAIAERLGLTTYWVLERLKENVERAMQTIPVKDNTGKFTGEYKYDGAAANKALELLGKHLGLFTERVEHSGNAEKPIQVKVIHEVVDPAPSMN